MSDSARLLRDYWFVMPAVFVFDALVIGGLSYGIWRALSRHRIIRYGCLAVLVIALTLFLAWPAQGFTRPIALKPVASVFAGRTVNVRCYDADEEDSPYGMGAWGYVAVPTAQQHYEALDSRICAGALNVNDVSLPVWQRSLGILVLTHEAYHLRKWGGSGDEGKVECKAIRHWHVAAQLLGASPATMDELWPWTLAVHYRLTDYIDPLNGNKPYDDPACNVPDLWTPPS